MPILALISPFSRQLDSLKKLLFDDHYPKNIGMPQAHKAAPEIRFMRNLLEKTDKN